MLDNEIEASEYKEIKTENEDEIERLERKDEELSTLDSNLREQIAFCCEFLQRLPGYFTAADLTAKQQILNSILQEKLVFEGKAYRTVKFKSIVALISRPGKDFKGGGNKKSSEFSELFTMVTGTGLFHDPILPRGAYPKTPPSCLGLFTCPRLRASSRRYQIKSPASTMLKRGLCAQEWIRTGSLNI